MGSVKIGFVGEALDLAEFLERQGFAVERLANALMRVGDDMRSRFDVLLVQTAHLTAEALDLCRWSLLAEGAPFVVIVSDAADEDERIQALEAGAADWLAEPADPREVRARVRAILRYRQRPRRLPEGWTFGGWRLDQVRRELCAPDGVTAVLTAGEFALLRCFVTEPQTLLSREALRIASSAFDRALDARVMDVRIARLRARFARAGGPDFIETVRGQGYVFARPVQTLE
jgi:two-component system, OmpR family, response regulator